MDLYTDSDSPSLDISVLNRLARHNDKLRVTWSKFVLDLDASSRNYSKPVITRWGEPILADVPSWYLWIKKDGRYHYIADYVHFGHLSINRLEADLFRQVSHQQAMDRIEWAKQAAEEKGLSDHTDKHRQMVSANKGRIKDLIFEGKSGKRTAKISSFAGQTNRSTPDEEFLVDAKEDGWELDRYE